MYDDVTYLAYLRAACACDSSCFIYASDTERIAPLNICIGCMYHVYLIMKPPFMEAVQMMPT